MNALKHSQAALGAFIAFILLFSAVMSGYSYFEAGREKAGEAAWTGDKAGVAITGFLTGANAKAVKSEKNPNPEVMPLTRELNERFFADKTKLFSWLVVLGEILMPIGVLGLLIVKFPYSRALLIGVATLAAFMNFLYLSEGVSSTNPPMAFMWLAIIWLAAVMPATALHYAVDLKALLKRGATEYHQVELDTQLGQWIFFGGVFAVIVAGSLAMFWDELSTFAVLAVVSVALAAGLYELNARLTRLSQRSARVAPAAKLQSQPAHR
jgi:thiosulfate dehydrogenase [quinone] large subunit